MPQAKPSYLDETQAYLNDLDLDCLPFTNISNRRFVYLSEADKELWSRVESIVESAAELIILVGPRGIGKTTQFEHATDLAQGKWHCSSQHASVITTPAKLVEILAKDLPIALEGETYEENIRELVGYWESLIDDGMIPVLLVDDAHLLSPALLEILFRLSQLRSNHCKSGLLHIILFSDTSLHKTLLDIPYCQQHIAQVAEINILPLSGEMVQEYLDFRLKVAGYNGAALFSTIDVDELAKHSNGLPGKLNMLAQEMLITKKRKKDFIKLPFTLSFKKTITAIAILSLFAVFLIPSASLNNILNVVSLPPEKSQNNSDLKVTQKTEYAETETGSLQYQPDSEKSVSLESDIKSGPNNSATGNTGEVLKSVGLNDSPLTNIQNKDIVFEKMISDAKDWLLTRNPNHYTIQLIGSSRQAAIQNFMDKYRVSDKVILLRTTKFDRPWYSIIKGDYATIEAAAEGIKALNPDLQRNQPWRRSFSSIQNEVTSQ